MKTGKSIRELVLERGLLDATRLDEILSVEAMTRGGIIGARRVGRVGQVGRIGTDRQCERCRARVVGSSLAALRDRTCASSALR